MGRLEELRQLREEYKAEKAASNGKPSETPTLDEFVSARAFADGSERVPATYMVEAGLAGLIVTLFEHMEGWSLVVEVEHHQDIPRALEAALCDLDYPRRAFKTKKKLPEWWKKLNKDTRHRP